MVNGDGNSACSLIGYVLTPVGWLVAGAQEEWRRGLMALHADTVDKLKKSLPKLEAEVQQVHIFRDFYKYAFQFCCTGKFVPLDTRRYSC